jgi:serine/threonine-protein kinase
MAKNPAERFPSAGELARAASVALHAAPAVANPPHTRQFPAERPYLPQPAPKLVASSRFSKTQKALLAGTVAMFALAAGLAAAIVFTGGRTASQPQSPLAAPPASTTIETSTTSTTTPPRSVAGVSNTDALGFVDHAARCDAGSSLVAAIRTSLSLAVICRDAPGSYYYHGERLRDGANVRLSNAVPTDGGYDAVNPADGARYQVRPDELTIISNGHVDSAESALEYGSAD